MIVFEAERGSLNHGFGPKGMNSLFALVILSCVLDSWFP